MSHRKQMNLNERLIRRIRALSVPLLPRPTGVKPILRRIPGIRAILFDVYGTMLVSASGDIGSSGRGHRNNALAESLKSAGFVTASRGVVRQGLDLLDRTIAGAHKTLRKKGCLYPEIDACSVWNVVLRTLKNQGMIVGPINLKTVRTLAVEYECRVNPVWPMPGLRRTLRFLRRAGVVFGIVSNAQFYTPLILQSFSETGWSTHWFDKDSCILSYRLREAKPSPRLLAKALRHLRARYGIRAGEVLCVGNDVLNDIQPAAEAGCRTALFAGDRRSYRPRRNELPDAAQTTDVVILTLAQLEKVVAPGRKG